MSAFICRAYSGSAYRNGIVCIGYYDFRAFIAAFSGVRKLVCKIGKERIRIQAAFGDKLLKHSKLSRTAGMQTSVSEIIAGCIQIRICAKFLIPLRVLIDQENVCIVIRNGFHLFCDFWRSACISRVFGRSRRSEYNHCVRIGFFYSGDNFPKLRSIDIAADRIVCSKHNGYNVRFVFAHTLFDILKRSFTCGAGNGCVDHKVVGSGQVFFYIFFKNLCNAVVSMRMRRGMRNGVSHKQPCQRIVFSQQFAQVVLKCAFVLTGVCFAAVGNGSGYGGILCGIVF